MPGIHSGEKAILYPVCRLEVPMEDLVVVGGAAQELFGIKRTNDIDVVLSDEGMNSFIERVTSRRSRQKLKRVAGKLVANPQAALVKQAEDDYSVATYGPLSVMHAPNDNLYQATFEELHEEAVEIDGVPVSPPHRILKWKQAINRQKDAADIEAIGGLISRWSTALGVKITSDA